MTSHEREITGPVDLCDGRRLSPAARGWSRHPMLRANLRGAWGRKKRWDYWCVITPEVVASLVYADIDYAGLAGCWILDRRTRATADASVLRPLGRGFELPDQVCTGTATIDTSNTHVVAKPSEGWSSEVQGRSTGGRPSAIFFPNELRKAQDGAAKKPGAAKPAAAPSGQDAGGWSSETLEPGGR